MPEFDFIVVGAGAAGCVLANRLSENPGVAVALIEAGPEDKNPFIHMPKGLAKVMADPKHIWAYASEPEAANAGKPEVWVRGRVLGGSSSINGMMYVRGQPADFDSLAEIAGDDWSWDKIGAAYRALENHELEPTETRGRGGPLNVTIPDKSDTLSRMMIDAGANLGWPIKEDVNTPDDGEGIGFAPRTVHRGRRQSAATCFIAPIRSRPNLTVLTERVARRVVFDGPRAVGIEVLHGDESATLRARREVILAGGAMASPGLLERSGIGDPAILKRLAIPIVHANPAVGENLLEHRAIIIQWRLKADLSQNKSFKGWRLLRSALRYYTTRGGPMASAAYELGAWFKTRPGLNRPDAQFLLAPFSFDFAKQRQDVEDFPGMHITAYPLRPMSRGSVHVTALDPNAAPRLVSNYREAQADRDAMVGAFRMARKLAEQPPLNSVIDSETMPGAQVQSDDEILAAYDTWGTCGYHAVGSCRMSADESNSVVDERCRVRGVTNLRVVDTSIMPIIPSGNTNGPTMAIAWRASDLILADHGPGARQERSAA